MVGSIVLFSNHNNSSGTRSRSSKRSSSHSSSDERERDGDIRSHGNNINKLIVSHDETPTCSRHQMTAANVAKEASGGWKRKAAADESLLASSAATATAAEALFQLRHSVSGAVVPGHDHKRARHMATLPDLPVKRRSVRFDTDPPQRHFYDNPLANLTEPEEASMRSKIWYTRQDFEAFLRDRIDTIQQWRGCDDGYYTSALQRQLLRHTASSSNKDDIDDESENDFCLRGLEPYQSSQVNAELHYLRDEHLQAILQEQERQRLVQQQLQRQSPTGIRDNDGNHEKDVKSAAAADNVPTEELQLDPERLRAVVAARSAWAMQRASRLAIQDSMDVVMMTTPPTTNRCDQRRKELQSHLPQEQQQSASGEVVANAAAAMMTRRRFSMPMLSSLSTGLSSLSSLPGASFPTSSSAASSVSRALLSASLNNNNLMLPSSSSCLSTMMSGRNNIMSSSSSPRRNSIAGGAGGNPLATTTSLRVPVDVNKLKEWNLQFMRNYMNNNHNNKPISAMSAAHDAMNAAACKTSITATASLSSSSSSCARESNMSLNSLMLGARHQQQQQHQHDHYNPTAAAAAAAGVTATAAGLPGMMDDRATSTTTTTSTTPSSFLPIRALRPMVRRDSLFGSNC